MHRFYISPQQWNPDLLVLTGAQAHHARDVLRLGRDDKVAVFNGRGREITAKIVDVSGREVSLAKLTQSETPPLRSRILLGQAIPKGKNMDLIVQKAVELGVAEIFPLISARTIVDLAQDEARKKQAKWQTVAIEAAKQSGQNWLPQIHLPQTMKQFFAELPPSDLQLIGSLQPGALHLKKILAEFAAEHRCRPHSVLMLIGPEGDFTPAELALARSHACRPITLGPIILRVETAAIYCLSVLSYELFAPQ
ncbi:MAG TPA: 16S rRNA (uracil(1498)-N(3))-methyltransferase [Chthoniobacterales bacterium]|nr:16S rRNA (uracil(1498)-N(3))-methyltransferase [Chthoniobacterales bacterium]